MPKLSYRFTSTVWLYSGQSAWHFATVPKKISLEIKQNFGDIRLGFGSQPVLVTVGQSSWRTSIFPDNKSGTYLLPLKLDIRKKENILVNQKIKIKISLI